MKINDKIEELGPGFGKMIGLIVASGIGLYDIYSEDINRKVAEIYNKLLPYINLSAETVRNVDPDLAQIGVSSTLVAALTSTLVYLRKKKKIESEEKTMLTDRIGNYAVINRNTLEKNKCLVKNDIPVTRYGTDCTVINKSTLEKNKCLVKRDISTVRYGNNYKRI